MGGTLFDMLLSGLVALLFWVFKGKSAKLDELSALLHKTREEYVTKSDLHHETARILTQIERVDDSVTSVSEKLDRLLERHIR